MEKIEDESAALVGKTQTLVVAFMLLDIEHKECIERDTLQVLEQALNISISDAIAMHSKPRHTFNLDPSVNIKQFIELFTPYSEQISVLLKTYKHFDDDRDGYVHIADVRDGFIMKSMKSGYELNEINALFDGLEANTEHKIDFKKFLEIGSLYFDAVAQRDSLPEESIQMLPNDMEKLRISEAIHEMLPNDMDELRISEAIRAIHRRSEQRRGNDEMTCCQKVGDCLHNITSGYCFWFTVCLAVVVVAFYLLWVTEGDKIGIGSPKMPFG